MNVAEIEARLLIEQNALERAVHAENPVAIAMFQGHVRDWERRLREARLAEEGGWH